MSMLVRGCNARAIWPHARGAFHNKQDLAQKYIPAQFQRRARSTTLIVSAAYRQPTSSGARPSSPAHALKDALVDLFAAVEEGSARLRFVSWRGMELRLLLQVGQVVASLAFVALYIWSTYEPVTRGSWRHTADLVLSAVFAADLAARIKSAGSAWPRVLLTPVSLLDGLSFAPGLMELLGAGWLGAGLAGAGVDLRWFRIFRALRLLRLCLLTGNLPLMKLSRSALLSGAVNVRLMQLAASVLALLFTSASLVHAVERLAWHDALYFVTTTLTTVGYGDVVVRTMAGRLIVLVFMAVGVVLIPVRTSQLWGQLASRRLTSGTLAPGRPVVLLSTRLSEVRGFADLTEEFFHQVQQQRFIPRDVHLMVLGNKPSYEFTAFQELHDSRMTLVEGSVLSAADLVRCRAEAAAAVLVLGDRFANDAAAEDLDVLFRVWAIKSYTKCVPLTVQVLRASALALVVPFLDPHQDVVMAVEQMRHRLMALSALCPGASTLLGNLLHTARTRRGLQESVFRPPGEAPPRLAGRSWLAEYCRGCGHDLHVVPLTPARGAPAAASTASTAGSTGAAAAQQHQQQRHQEKGQGQRQQQRAGPAPSLVGCTFGCVVRAAFGSRHVLVIGVVSGHGTGRVRLNPPHSTRLGASDHLITIAHSEAHADGVRHPDVAAAALALMAEAAEAEAAAAAKVRKAAAAAVAVPAGDAGGPSGAAAAAAAAEVPPPPPRVKRYYPSLASWDEESVEDAYADREGSFFSSAAWVTAYGSDATAGASRQRGADDAAEARAAASAPAAAAATPEQSASRGSNRAASEARSAGAGTSGGCAADGVADASGFGGSLHDLGNGVDGHAGNSHSQNHNHDHSQHHSYSRVNPLSSGSLDEPPPPPGVSAAEADIGGVGTPPPPLRAPQQPSAQPPPHSPATRGGRLMYGTFGRTGDVGKVASGGASSRSGGGGGPAASPAYVSAATAGAMAAVGHSPPVPTGRPYSLADAPWRQREPQPGGRRGHVILAGAVDSFVEFARVLHSCAGMRDPDSGFSCLEVVVLHPAPPESVVLALGAMGPTRLVRGNPADPRALAQAGAGAARCLVYLGPRERPAGQCAPADSSPDAASTSTSQPSASDYGTTSRAGVQADAEALLTCYGVGEEASVAAGAEPGTDGSMSLDEVEAAALYVPSAASSSSSAAASYGSVDSGGGGGVGGGGGGHFQATRGSVRGHSVVELSFTSSVRFLQPGLLLQGNSVWDQSCSIGGAQALPRRSWRQRREAEAAAGEQGLVQWQTNIYYGAGRVVVPSLIDTFTIQAFAKRNLLLDVMSELCGDDGRPGGTLLRLLPVPRELAGRPYRALFDALVTRGSVPLGLYRSKPENPAWRLHFVSTNPAWEDVVSADDKVFVLRAAE